MGEKKMGMEAWMKREYFFFFFYGRRQRGRDGRRKKVEGGEGRNGENKGR